MSDLSEIVATLENRISKLLHKYENLKQKNIQLELETDETQKLLAASQEEVQQWREKCSSLQLANSMLGSDQHKRETKLKINALVREIDQCISQLSE
jgi:chromosome segregation ATPase